MMTRTVTCALCCLAIAACGGGGGDDGVNAATARTFSYLPPEATSQPPAAGDAVGSLSSFEAAPDAASAEVAQGSLVALAFEALGDDLGVGGFAATSGDTAALTSRTTAALMEARTSTLRSALTGAAAQFSGACARTVEGAGGTTTVTFSDCTYSETSTDGTMTLTASGTVSGKPGQVAWNVRYRLSFSGTNGTLVLGYDDVGDVAISPSAAIGHQEADIAVAFSSGGQRAELAFAQAVDLDVGLSGSCATNVTSGTLEVKRVWTRRPAGASSDDPEVKDRGVLFTWTGCGTATVQLSR